MGIFIGHFSALEYWGSHDFDPSTRRRQAIPQKGAAPKTSSIDKDELLRLGIKRPFHVLVATANDRRPSSDLIFHVMGDNYPRRSFIELESGVFLSTPEACFLQVAQNLSLVQLAILGFELCGFYATSRYMTCAFSDRSKRDLAEDAPFLKPERALNQPLRRRSPRTTPEKLSTYLVRAQGRKHASKALHAAKLVFPNSASPMETALAMLLCLPSIYGGYGLPKPKLNHKIALGGHAQANSPFSRVLYADLCWPREKLILEYDSDQYHTGAEKINKDSRRRTLLELEGYHVLSVTKKQLYCASAFEETARAAANHLGHRIRIRTKDYPNRQYLLRKDLFAQGR